MGLATTTVAAGVTSAWNQLLIQALDTDAERLVSRLQPEGQSSAIQRHLFSSLHCPIAICPDGPDENETARLLRSLRLLEWDFESEPSTSESDAIVLCRSLLAQGDTELALQLWSRLQSIAAEARTTGSSFRLATLIEKLQGRFELQHHPDFRSDWVVIRKHYEETRATIKDEIGRGIRLSRDEVLGLVRQRLTNNRVMSLRPGSESCRTPR